MTDDIVITEYSPAAEFKETWEDKQTGVEEQALRGLRPWAQALGRLLASEFDVTADAVVDMLAAVDPSRLDGGDQESWHMAAARLTAQYSKEHTPVLAVAAGFFLLKTRGWEPGEAPAGHWKLNRLLNGGDRVLDLLIADHRFRRLALETLFYRVLDSALAQAEITERGVIAEVPCKVDWNADADSPWRRRLPDTERSDAQLASEVVDWLLEQLVARGLSSVTLGSVIEESRAGRAYEIDDGFGEWIAELSAHEARFIAGALFLPATLGGWPRSVDEGVLDAQALALEISEEFSPRSASEQVYSTYYRQIEELRRLPEQLSPTYEIDDGDQRWQARWAVNIHPVRRDRAGQNGFFALEAGLYFDDRRPQVSDFSKRRGADFVNQLQAMAAEKNERSFAQYGQLLDQIIDGLHRNPQMLMKGRDTTASPSQVGRSPLWSDLATGVEQLASTLEKGELDELADGFRRWTLRCTSSD